MFGSDVFGSRMGRLVLSLQGFSLCWLCNKSGWASFSRVKSVFEDRYYCIAVLA